MTQEDKERLLLKDLCARQPYRVKVQYKGAVKEIQYIEPEFGELCLAYPDNTFTVPVVDCKPYLRPMSSMTEEEKEEYCNIQDKFLCSSQYPVTDAYELFDWLNKNHFDYRGLIEKGLALEAPEGMYN